MTHEEISVFLAHRAKVLPVVPKWRQVNRTSERRANLPIEVGGVLSRAELQLVTSLREPDYLVILLLSPRCFARLCLGKAHRDARTRELVTDPHFHGWGKSGFALDTYEILPASIGDRGEAFAWFLRKVGIESPAWLPIEWPGERSLV